MLDKDLEKGELTVRHREIAGLMPAMTMPYRVVDSTSIRTVQAGDEISAELVISRDSGKSRLEDIHITGHWKDLSGAPQSAHRALLPGESAPDIPLVNQDGKTIRLGDFSGKALLITSSAHAARCPTTVHDGAANLPEFMTN